MASAGIVRLATHGTQIAAEANIHNWIHHSLGLNAIQQRTVAYMANHNARCAYSTIGMHGLTYQFNDSSSSIMLEEDILCVLDGGVGTRRSKDSRTLR